MMTIEERITAKLTEAKEQLAGWQQQLSTAAAQVERWDAVRQACEELLAPQNKTPTGEDGGENGNDTSYSVNIARR